MSEVSLNALCIHILDKEYRIGCPADQRESLQEAADHLDAKMREIRQGGKAIGLDRIAVMAALNITHSMLSDSEDSSAELKLQNEALEHLEDKIDVVLDQHRQMEL